MRKYFYIFVLVFSFGFPFKLYSAFDYYPIPPRYLSVGGALLLKNDIGSILFNPAGLNSIMGKQVESVYSRIYPGLDIGIDGYTLIGGYGLGRFGFGLSFSSLKVGGLYRENITSVGVGKTMKVFQFPVSMGFSLKFLGNDYVIDDEKRVADDVVFSRGSQMKNFSFDFGVIHRRDKYSFGIVGKNLNQPDVGLYERVKLPLTLSFDFIYKVFYNMDGRFCYGYSYFDRRNNFRIGYYQNIYSDVLKGYLGTNFDGVGFAVSFVLPYPKFALTFEYGYYVPLYMKDTFGTHTLSLKAEF